MMRSSAVLLIAAMVGVASGQTALFLDSQANRFEVTRSESKISLNCPDCRFEGSDRIYDLPVNLRDLPLHDGAFDARQVITGGNIIYNGFLHPSGWIRLKVDIPGVDAPFDLALAPYTKEAVKPKAKPSRIVVRVRQPSAVIGQWTPLEIYLTDSGGALVAPEKELTLHLEVEGGTPLPAIARLTPEAPKVPGGIAPTSKQATLRLKSPGLDSAVALAIGCETKTDVNIGLKMNAAVERATADGVEGAPIILSLVDENGTPVTDGTPKQVKFEVGGVARIAAGTEAAKEVTIAAGQCAEERRIVADSAGIGKASAEFKGKYVESKVVFRPALTPLLGLLVFGGALAGLFASAARNFGVASKWKFSRWFSSLIVACIGAVAIAGAYYYGLLPVAAGLPGGPAFAFLTALIGGFLGAAAYDKLKGTPA